MLLSKNKVCILYNLPIYTNGGEVKYRGGAGHDVKSDPRVTQLVTEAPVLGNLKYTRIDTSISSRYKKKLHIHTAK